MSDSTATSGVEQGLMRNGGLSYLEIPAADIERSAQFYAGVLHWSLDRREDGQCKFRDPAGLLIGAFRADRSAVQKGGMLPYFYVSGMFNAVAGSVEQLGGAIVKPPFREGNLWICIARDPAGNLIGLWQLAE